MKFLAVLLQLPARINGRCYHKAEFYQAPRVQSISEGSRALVEVVYQSFGEELERSCKDDLDRCSWCIQVSPVKGNGSFQHCRVSCSEITPGTNAL